MANTTNRPMIDDLMSSPSDSGPAECARRSSRPSGADASGRAERTTKGRPWPPLRSCSNVAQSPGDAAFLVRQPISIDSAPMSATRNASNPVNGSERRPLLAVRTGAAPAPAGLAELGDLALTPFTPRPDAGAAAAGELMFGELDATVSVARTWMAGDGAAPPTPAGFRAARAPGHGPVGLRMSSPFWCPAWAASALSAIVISTNGLVSDPVAWQMVTLPCSLVSPWLPWSTCEPAPVGQPPAGTLRRSRPS